MITHQQDKIPLVLGITGHRNLHPNELKKIRESIRKVIDLLRNKYPHTPLILLSPLAEGADRLVAHIAQEEDIQVIAPLPLPKAEYLRDFKTQESLEEFDTLLEKSNWFELPILNQGIEEKESFARNTQYALVGAYVARHSHILLALWDGREQSSPGSTHAVIQSRLTGDMVDLPSEYKPPDNPLDFVDIGKVCHIKVSRDNDDKQHIDAGEIRILALEEEPSTDLHLLLSKQFLCIDEFNQDVDKYIEHHGKITFDKGKIPTKDILPRLSKHFQKMSRIHEVASSLSISNRRFTDKAMIALFCIGFFMVVAIEIYAYPPPWLYSGKYPWFLSGYLLLFMSGYFVFYLANKEKIHNKYLHYRALAEALRVQMFWQLGGLNESVADYYQHKYHNELDWIRTSVRSLCTHNWINDQQGIKLVKKYWIEKQIKYFKKRIHNSVNKLTRLKKISRWLLALGLLLAVILFCCEWWFPDCKEHYPVPHNTLSLLMIFFPAIGVVLGGYVEKAGFDTHLKRSLEMEKIFQRANQELEKSSKDCNQQCVLLELGKAALEENNDWLLLHRDRPLELPKG